MLLTGDLYIRSINVLVEKFSKKKPEIVYKKQSTYKPKNKPKNIKKSDCKKCNPKIITKNSITDVSIQDIYKDNKLLTLLLLLSMYSPETASVVPDSGKSIAGHPRFAEYNKECINKNYNRHK